MRKVMYLFSGQGSQYFGMGGELCHISPSARNIYEVGSQIVGFDLAKASFEEEGTDLSATLVSQPVIFAASLAAFVCMQEQGMTMQGVAGHSLGEYAAMVASGMLSLEDGFRVIRARAAAMQKAAEQSDGAMCAVMGCDVDVIDRICADTDGYVVPVNYNSPAQTVIAGERLALRQAVTAFEKQGIRCIPLAVQAAFHSKLMEGAAKEFYQAMKQVDFHAPQTAFYSNLTGGELTDFSDMPAYLARHLVSPVRFVEELQHAQSDGYDTFIELGPNKVLTGLVRKTLKGVEYANVENQKTLEKALALLRA